MQSRTLASSGFHLKLQGQRKMGPVPLPLSPCCCISHHLEVFSFAVFTMWWSNLLRFRHDIFRNEQDCLEGLDTTKLHIFLVLCWSCKGWIAFIERLTKLWKLSSMQSNSRIGGTSPFQVWVHRPDLDRDFILEWLP